MKKDRHFWILMVAVVVIWLLVGISLVRAQETPVGPVGIEARLQGRVEALKQDLKGIQDLIAILQDPKHPNYAQEVDKIVKRSTQALVQQAVQQYSQRALKIMGAIEVIEAELQ